MIRVWEVFLYVLVHIHSVVQELSSHGLTSRCVTLTFESMTMTICYVDRWYWVTPSFIKLYVGTSIYSGDITVKNGLTLTYRRAHTVDSQLTDTRSTSLSAIICLLRGQNYNDLNLF